MRLLEILLVPPVCVKVPSQSAPHPQLVRKAGRAAQDIRAVADVVAENEIARDTIGAARRG